MLMKKRYVGYILIPLLLLSTLLVMTGCSATLSGTFYRDVNDARYYTFNEDGTCTLTDGGEVFQGTFTKEGRTITITLEGGSGARQGKIWGKTLTLDEFGYENKYIRK